MASIITHSIAAVIFGKTLTNKLLSKKFWIFVAIFSIIPDADVISFKFGIPYENFWGHRGFTHSFLFAFLIGAAGSGFYLKSFNITKAKFWGWTLFFFAITSTHTLLDAMTNGGLGVAFFSPFENSRYFLPFRPLEVSPIGVKRFISARGVTILLNEFSYVILPLLGFLGIKKLYLKTRHAT
jgi:inner membrane protein